MSKIRVLVSGGGFIGHHLTRYLAERGYRVRAVDIKEPEYEASGAHEFKLLNLMHRESCLKATEGIDQVYGLAVISQQARLAFLPSLQVNAELDDINSVCSLHSIILLTK